MNYFNAKAYLFDTRTLSIAAWNGHADPKPDTIVHKTVRRLRTGTLVPGNHINWFGPPLLHCTDLGKALDAINPSRQGVEVDCCIRGLMRPGVSKVTSTWTLPKVAPDFKSILAIGPFMQPRIDVPLDHAWSTLQTCEAIIVTNTKRRIAKRSLQRKLKVYNDEAWTVNPASFE